MTIQELRQKKAARVAEARALLAKAQTENRSLNADESAKFTALQAAITDLEAQEARQQFLDDAERRQAGTVVAGERGDGLADVENRVSLLRVLQAGTEQRSLDGAEAEYNAEMERRNGRKAKGLYVPMRLLEQRVNTAANNGELVPTNPRSPGR